MVMEGMALVPNILNIPSTASTTILLPFSPYASLLMPTMCNLSRRKKSSLDVTVFFLMYMYKLVCINSYRNKEALREKYQLGSNGGATAEST